jgi:hypothetical protein
MEHPSPQLLGRRVNQLNLIRFAQRPIRHSLSNGYAGDLFDGVGDAFEVLDVYCRYDIDAGIEEFHNVLPPLVIAAGTGGICVSQFIDERNLGVPSENGVEVHLGKDRSPVLDDLHWNHLEVSDQLLGERSPVTLHESDDDVSTPLLAPVTLAEHRVGLPNPGSGAEVDSEVTSRLDTFTVV